MLNIDLKKLHYDAFKKIEVNQDLIWWNINLMGIN